MTRQTKTPRTMEAKMMLKKMGRSEIQSNFLASVRSRLPEHLSLPDELAELLKISRDSAYRRIREETFMTLDEVQIICDRYCVSVDSLMTHASATVPFELSAQTGPGVSFKSWLESVLKQLQNLESVPGASMILHTKDLPIFHYFQFPRLAAFKLYCWKKLSGGEDFGKNPYDESIVGVDLIRLGEKLWETYSRLSSTEIVSREMINTTLRQIEYAFDCGHLSRAKAIELCQDCTGLIQQLQQQTQRGCKQTENPQKPAGSFDVYLNELLIGDNTILFNMGEKQTTFVTHNNFNILSTSHAALCRQTEQFMKFTMQKSVQISRVAEKERAKFFCRIFKQIEETQQVVEGARA